MNKNGQGFIGYAIVMIIVAVVVVIAIIYFGPVISKLIESLGTLAI